jgi:hypothetical protein
MQTRREQAQKVCELWLSLSDYLRPGTITDEVREASIVSRLAELCSEEILLALRDDLPGRVLCGVWLVIDFKHGRAGWLGDDRIVRSGIRRALRAKQNNEGADIVALVRSGLAEELTACRDARIEELRARKAKEILLELLDIVRRGQHVNAGVLIDHLTDAQRSDLAALVHDRITDKVAVHIRMDLEPEVPQMWLYWYLQLSQLALPKNRSKMGGIPRDVIAIRRGAARTNRRGEIVMPLGPMYAKVFEALKREMNRRGLRPKNPGVSKIAEGLHVDHSTAKRWLKANVPVKVEPDGTGGVHYTFNLDTIQICTDILAGNKRGPRPRTDKPPSAIS